MKKPYFIILTIVFSACSSHPETPEEVVKEFSLALSEGRCEDALKLTTDETKEAVQDVIESGCLAYESTVDSVVCKSDKVEASCNCYETRSEVQMTFGYVLSKEENVWKVRYLVKDVNYLW